MKWIKNWNYRNLLNFLELKLRLQWSPFLITAYGLQLYHKNGLDTKMKPLLLGKDYWPGILWNLTRICGEVTSQFRVIVSIITKATCCSNSCNYQITGTHFLSASNTYFVSVDTSHIFFSKGMRRGRQGTIFQMHPVSCGWSSVKLIW